LEKENWVDKDWAEQKNIYCCTITALYEQASSRCLDRINYQSDIL